jgi:hypothetical protein
MTEMLLIGGAMTLSLDESRRTRLISEIKGFFPTEFDEKVSSFQAE